MITEEKVQALAKQIFGVAQKTLETHGSLPPTLFLGNSKMEVMMQNVTSFFMNNQKEQLVSVIKRMTSQLDLDIQIVILLSEGFLAQANENNLKELQEEYNRTGSVQSMKGSKEIVLMNIETQLGVWFAKSEIQLVDGKRMFVVPEVKRLEEVGAEGILTGFFGPTSETELN